MAELAKCACHRCREQKLRCSREQPICTRCSRLDAICTYPQPPNRKLLATKRNHTRKRKLEAGSIEPSSGVNHDGPAPLARPQPTPVSKIPINSSELGPITANGSQLSSSLEKLLLEVYFTYIFSSCLIFHRHRFEQAFAQGAVSRHLILAIYALATNFLEPLCPLAADHEQEIMRLGDVRAVGRQWAQMAGENALRSIDEPTLDKVQTCQLLTLYWFSAGESRRNIIFSTIAYRASREIVFDEDNEDDDGIDKIAFNRKPEAEMRRRCFWAAYIAYCVNSDQYTVGSSVDTVVMSVPLPSSERSFNYLIQEPLFTLSDVADNGNLIASIRRSGEANVWADIIRLMLHWTKIRDHIEARKRLSSRESLVDLLSLDDWLLAFSRDLSPSLVYSKDNLRARIEEKSSLSFALLHAVYHQCRLVLHTSLVPQFSGQPLQDKIPHMIIQSSARTAMESAQAMSRLASDILALNEDPARLAPFVGHCMYVAASIHIAFVSSRNDALRAEAWRNLEPTIKVLKIMLPYWKNLEKLWARIHVLYETQASKLTTILNENATQPPDSVEQVAETRRDSGRLAEPLADSVLQYSLRRLLRKKVTVDATSPIAQQLEAVAAAGSAASRRVARIMRDSVPSETTPLSSDSYNLNFQNATRQDERQLPDQSAQLYDNFSSTNLFPDDDWWSLDFDPFQPPILPYTDLFGENAMIGGI